MKGGKEMAGKKGMGHCPEEFKERVWIPAIVNEQLTAHKYIIILIMEPQTQMSLLAITSLVIWKLHPAIKLVNILKLRLRKGNN